MSAENAVEQEFLKENVIVKDKYLIVKVSAVVEPV